MTTKRIWLLVVALALLFAFAASALAGEHQGDKKSRLGKTTTNDHYQYFLINNIFNFYSNNGDASYNKFTENSGGEYPKGSGLTFIFEEGFVWGAYKPGVNTATPYVVGGSAYRSGLQAGSIVSTGVAEDPGLASNRVYRVRPDIGPADALNAALTTKIDAEETALIGRFDAAANTTDIYNQYIADWNEWPATKGAPFEDKNSNGTYEAGIDVPGVPGADQTLWFVANDLDSNRTKYLYGSYQIGLELQRTIWGYKRTGALGNIVFVRHKLINKSGAPLDSVYLVQWSDPDLGDAGDDFAGVDTTNPTSDPRTKRNLGYVYNARARDSYYGTTPPAGGYDFFQGPRVFTNVATDSATFDNKYVKRYKNLPMSAFVFFINSSAVYTDPPQGNINGTKNWMNLMKGRISTTGAPFIDPTTGLATKFTLAGDPVARTGWNDGTVAPAGDRRFCMVAGPFTMTATDTQEVVVALLVGMGGDRLSSISVLRFYADQAQAVFNQLFDVPNPPKAPVVSITGLDNELVIDWSTPANVTATEVPVNKGYAFQGYNFYQATSVAGENAKLLNVYDLIDGVGKIFDNDYDPTTGVVLNKPVQFGNDNGVVRFVDVKDDFIRSTKLTNGRSYYFAVTAYSYNPTGVPKTLESAPQWTVGIPQQPAPGSAVHSTVGTMVSDTTKTSSSDGSLAVRVVDPTKVTGHTYTFYFTQPGATKYWNLVDATTSDTLLKNQSLYGDNVTNPIVHGIQWGVMDPGAAGGIKSVTCTVLGGVPQSPPANVVRLNSPYADWGVDAAGSTSTASAYSRMNWAGGAGLSDYEFRVTPNDATASEYYLSAGGALAGAGSAKAAGRIPVQVWDVTTNTRLIPNVLDDDASASYTRNTGGLSAVTAASWERIYVSSVIPYAEPLPVAPPTDAGPSTEKLGRFIFLDFNNNGFFPPAGTIVKLTVNKPILTTDSWTVRTSSLAAVTNSSALAKDEVEKVNVYPNPYFGFNLDEPSKYIRFVTFNHLPVRATVRIFTLAGVLVRTLEKNDASQFLRWDLNNQSGLPVAAGMFVVYVDMPDQGKTKILKLAVIPEAQILDKL